MDLDGRASKVEREAEKRRLAAKAKIDSEAAAARRQREREAELRALEAQRKELEEVRQADAAAKAQAEFRLTAGINFQELALEPFLLESAEDDKVTLPEAALQALSQTDAFSLGVVMFRISAGAATTHCGVREFSAPEGRIGLPIKVVESLLRRPVPTNQADPTHSQTLSQLGRVAIKYVRLPTARFARLQPLHNLFSSVAAVKEVLEQNLRFHTTLTAGDLVTIWFRGTAHALCVVEVRHARAAGDKGADSDMSDEPTAGGCSLVDTDVEIDLDVSQEYQQAQLGLGQVAAGTQSAVGTTSAQLQLQSKGRTLVEAIAQPATFAAGAGGAAFASAALTLDPNPPAVRVSAAEGPLPPPQMVDREAVRQKRLEALARRGGGAEGGGGV